MYFELWLFFCVLYLHWISCFVMHVKGRWWYTIYMWLFRKSETTYFTTAVKEKLMSLMRLNSVRASALLAQSWLLRQFRCILPRRPVLAWPLCGLPFSLWVCPGAHPCRPAGVFAWLRFLDASLLSLDELILNIEQLSWAPLPWRTLSHGSVPSRSLKRPKSALLKSGQGLCCASFSLS